MKDKVSFLFRKTSLGRLFYGSKRKIKEKKAGAKTLKVSSTERNIFLSKIKLFILNIPKRILLITFVSIIILIGFIFFRSYNQLNTRPFFENQKHTAPLISDNRELNLLFVVIDDSKPGYYFINSIAYININFDIKEGRIYTINPNFIITTSAGVDSTIRSFLSTTLSQDSMTDLENGIEGMLGVRVDRYVAITSNNFNNLLSYTGTSITLNQDLIINDQKLNEESKLNAKELATIFNNSDFYKTNSDEISLLYSEAIQEYFSYKYGTLDQYRYFWNSAWLTEILRTDLKKSELINFVGNIDKLAKPLPVVNILSDQGTLISNTIEPQINPNYNLINETIQNAQNNVGILTERAEVEVFNGTPVSGLANEKKRELQNLGINIVKYGNYYESYTKNTLYVVEGKAENFPNTIQAINRAFRGELEIIIGNYPGNYTGDLVLILGQ